MSLSSSPLQWAAAALCASGLALFGHQGAFVRVQLGARSADAAALAEVRGLISDRWVERPDAEALTEGALHGMVGTLDPFSEFIPPSEADEFQEHTTGRFGGLGFYITVEDGVVVVIAPIEDTPAWHAGILPRDRIVAIDGVPCDFKNAGEAVRRLKGEVGTSVELTVLHEGSERPEVVRVERAVVQVKTVKGTRILDPEGAKVGYTRITSFNLGTTDEVVEALTALEAAGMKALIVDLRGNPGGYLDRAIQIADLFLAEGQRIVSTRGRNDPDHDWDLASAPRRVTVPVAVLIDGGSASASEVLGGALDDNGVATLIGTRSYGKGSVQTLFPVLGGRAQLKLTTQYYYSPSGRRIHRGEGLGPEDPSWGLLPDLEVDVDPRARRALAQAESDREIARLQQLARAGQGGELPEERLHQDDPQVRAAHRHLRGVLAGEERLGAPRPLPPADVAPVGSATPASGGEEAAPEGPRADDEGSR